MSWLLLHVQCSWLVTKMDITLRQVLSAGPKGVLPRESWLHGCLNTRNKKIVVCATASVRAGNNSWSSNFVWLKTCLCLKKSRLWLNMMTRWTRYQRLQFQSISKIPMCQKRLKVNKVWYVRQPDLVVRLLWWPLWTNVNTLSKGRPYM